MVALTDVVAFFFSSEFLAALAGTLVGAALTGWLARRDRQINRLQKALEKHSEFLQAERRAQEMLMAFDQSVDEANRTTEGPPL